MSTAKQRQAEHSRRSGRRLSRCVAAVVCVWLLSAAATAQIALPDFGDPARAGFSLSDERALGELFMNEVRAHLKLNDDPEVERYVSRLGYRIASQSDRGGFTFFVVDDPAVNAFAGPGGYIGVNSGLILAAEGEAEVASVLAHEIAHVTQNHIARAIDAADRSSIPTMAGLLAAIILGTQNPAAGQAAAAAVVGSRIQRQLDFTRGNEQEADRVGMQLLAAAELDPRAMPAFFERLQESIRYSRQPPEFLSTHPVTASRIADTRARAEKYPYRQYVDSIDFHLVRAKLRAETFADPAEALAWFDEKIASGEYRSETGVRYGRALVLTRLARFDEARREYERVLRTLPDNTAVQAALASNELAAGNTQRALDIYARALRVFPDDSVLIRGDVEALLAAGRAEDALRRLDQYSRRNRMNAPLYRLQALAYERLGRQGESLLALAEHSYLNGRLEVAIHQLEQAQALPNLDFYIGSRIDARLRELRNERSLRTAK